MSGRVRIRSPPSPSRCVILTANPSPEPKPNPEPMPTPKSDPHPQVKPVPCQVNHPVDITAAEIESCRAEMAQSGNRFSMVDAPLIMLAHASHLQVRSCMDTRMHACMHMLAL